MYLAVEFGGFDFAFAKPRRARQLLPVNRAGKSDFYPDHECSR
jgi:hypothetical protein